MVQHSPPVPREYRALAPDDFSFFGFDDLDDWLERRLQNVEIRGGTPQVSIVENAVYVPQRVAQKKGSQRAEVVKSLLESSAVAYDHYEHEIDEEVVYLGWRFDHFGHFLMQSLARTWFLTEVSPSVRVLFDPPHRAWGQPTGWVHRMLEAFGVPPERILILNAPTRLRRLIIPEPLFEPRGVAHDHVVRAHEAMARPYQAVAKRLAGDTTPSEQPLYLSRRRLPPSQRTIVGEGDLEEVLRANGFRIAYTETMTFEDQVRLVNEHADIFSNAGSAAHNVLFALHEPRLHLLTNGRDLLAGLLSVFDHRRGVDKLYQLPEHGRTPEVRAGVQADAEPPGHAETSGVPRPARVPDYADASLAVRVPHRAARHGTMRHGSTGTFAPSTNARAARGS